MSALSEQDPKEFDQWARESGHWYWSDGRPAYTIIGKNGKERNTTLRDARVHNLHVGTTTVTGLVRKPGLEAWQQEQMLMAALTLPRLPGEVEKDWLTRVRQDSKEQARKAAERGTELHAAIERYYKPGALKVKDAIGIIALHAVDVIQATFGEQAWSTERSFASPLGYGGKVDLHAPGLVLDIKTKDGDVSQVQMYEEVEMQLAAYAYGLGMPDARCAAVYVSRDKPQVAIREVDDVGKSFRMFKCLLDYWQMSKGYTPKEPA